MRKFLTIILILFSCVLVNSQNAKKQFIYQNLSQTVTDTNTYVVIGTQTWMKYNLRLVRYTTGAGIPKVTGNTAWAALTTPAYCYYNNDSATNYKIYGALYNWYAVNTGNICPTGTHVPSNTEWDALVTYLGGAVESGGHIKQIGTTHWNTPNTGADNSSGFTALGHGYRYGGVFYAILQYGDYWSADQYDSGNSYVYSLMYTNAGITKILSGYDKPRGLAVRCIKN